MTLAAPFPYFGGKRRAAPLVWGALGDPSGYVEPFAGSAAVLLARPAFTGRRVETINDADGWLVNTWRAIALHPGDVARHAGNASLAASISTVEVTQQFANPFSEKNEALYVFPLPEDAAVNDFLMTIGSRTIRGVIRERKGKTGHEPRLVRNG